ncbi:MAG: DMT family transporter, partial [Lachnospiraceae bacterium]|nr:DMT family transporter [Lachnospiraceae bacterium]
GRHSLYHHRQGGLYYHHVRGHRPHPVHLSEEEGPGQGLALRPSVGHRPVSPQHAGRLLPGKGRFPGPSVRITFAFQILAINRYAPLMNGILLTCLEFFAEALLSTVFMFIFETPALPSLRLAFWSILYAGVMSSGIAYTLQVITQKHLDPTIASLIMSLESVFAALTGWLILHQTLSLRELSGCALMFVSILLSQLPAGEKKSTREPEAETGA